MNIKLAQVERENKELRRRVFELENVLLQRRQFREKQFSQLSKQLFHLHQKNSKWITKMCQLEYTAKGNFHLQLAELLMCKSSKNTRQTG